MAETFCVPTESSVAGITEPAFPRLGGSGGGCLFFAGGASAGVARIGAPAPSSSSSNATSSAASAAVSSMTSCAASCARCCVSSSLSFSSSFSSSSSDAMTCVPTISISSSSSDSSSSSFSSTTTTTSSSFSSSSSKSSCVAAIVVTGTGSVALSSPPSSSSSAKLGSTRCVPCGSTVSPPAIPLARNKSFLDCPTLLLLYSLLFVCVCVGVPPYFCVLSSSSSSAPLISSSPPSSFSSNTVRRSSISSSSRAFPAPSPSPSSSSATTVSSVSHPLDSSSNVLFALSVFISVNFSVLSSLFSISFSSFSSSSSSLLVVVLENVNWSMFSFCLAIFKTIRPSLAKNDSSSSSSFPFPPLPSSSSPSSRRARPSAAVVLPTTSPKPPTRDNADRIASLSPPATTARIAFISFPRFVSSHCRSNSRSVVSRSVFVNRKYEFFEAFGVVVVVG